MKKIFSFTILIVGIFFYYLITWGSLQNFSQKFDPCERLFCDFAIHYYPTVQTILEQSEPIYGYLYSPFFAILTEPLGDIKLESALRIWGALQIILTLALFVTPLSVLKLDTLDSQLIYTGVFFTSLPVLHNFKWGQISSLIVLTVIAAFMAERTRKSIWAGILLGFSTSIKYYPGLFILYFLLKKDKRAVIAFVISCFVFLFLAPILILGFDNWLHFMSLSIKKLSIFGSVADNTNTQYFPHVLMRFLGLEPSRIFIIRILKYISFGIAICNFGLLWFIHKRNLDTNGFLSLSLLFCTFPFLIETSWHHYFIFLPFVQMYFLQIENKKWIRFLVFPSTLLSSIFLLQLFPTWWDYTKWGFSFFSSLAILATIYLLIFTSYRQKRDVS